MTNCPDINGDGYDEIICDYVIGMDGNISIDNSIIIDDPNNKILFSGGIVSFSNLLSDTTISIVIGDKETFYYTWHGTGKVLIYNNDVINSIGDDSNPMVIKDFKLYQNYPNPFNPCTIITYSIPKVSNVKLVVYDIKGEEVAVLIDKIHLAGNHTVNFDASKFNLASGIYFYTLISDNFIQTNKMVYLR